MDRIGAFFKELRRRRVFRVAALYVIGAWVVLQVADLAFPGLGIPDWAIRYVWIGAFLGFPIALIFGWRFDIIGGHLIHTPDSEVGEPDLSLRRTDYLILAALAVIVSAITFGLVKEIKEVQVPDLAAVNAVEIDPNSVAVLPFADKSAGDEDASFLAFGIHDEILSLLSHLRELKVISRTSVAQYKKSDKSLRQIGRELGVAKILEGSVQRAGSQVRVTAQLIDATTDEHLWADSFDIQLTANSVFAVQSQVAKSVIKELKLAITPETDVRIDRVPTQSFAALEAFFRGKEAMEERTVESLARSMEYFQEATGHDPGFAAAYALYGESSLLHAIYSGDRGPRATSKKTIDRALAIDPLSSEAYSALGFFRSWYEEDRLGAESALRRSIELDPNNSIAHFRLGEVLQSQNRYDEALLSARKAVELDPRSVINAAYLAYTLLHSGRYNEAVEWIYQVIEANPDSAQAYRVAGVMHATLGRPAEAVPLYMKSIQLAPGNNRPYAYLSSTYLDLGDDVGAESWSNRALEIAPESSWSNRASAEVHLYRGERSQALERLIKALEGSPKNDWVLDKLRDFDLLANNPQVARERYRTAHPTLFSSDGKIHTTAKPAIDLATVHFALDEREQGEKLLRFALKEIDGKSRLGNWGFGIADVKIFVLQGKTSQALKALQEAVDAGWRTGWWYDLLHDPTLEPIRGAPEFEELVNQIREDMAQQLSRIKEMEANGELPLIDMPRP